MESITDLKCDICQKSFPEQTFTAHQRLHSEDKFHPCDLCGIVFTTREDSYQHNCDLTIEGPFSCDICQLKCKKLSHLTIHKRIHSKPYSCEICKKSFSYSSELIRHKRTHSGEKPYSCEVCQKSFAENWALKRHKKGGPHLKRQKILNTIPNSNHNEYIDCGEDIKVEDTKEESNEMESVEDPPSVQLNNQTNHQEESPCDYVDCDEAIKVEDIKIENTNQEDGITEDIIFKEEDNLIDEIKEEIEEDVSVNYFLSIHEENNDIKEEGQL